MAGIYPDFVDRVSLTNRVSAALNYTNKVIDSLTGGA